MTRMNKDHEVRKYERELEVAVDLARAAGKTIIAQYEKPLRVETKNHDDDIEPVTQADRIANELIDAINARYATGIPRNP